MNAFCSHARLEAAAAEIRSNWPLVVYSAQLYNNPLLIAAAQADLNRDDGEARAASIELQSATQSLSAACSG